MFVFCGANRMLVFFDAKTQNIMCFEFLNDGICVLIIIRCDQRGIKKKSPKINSKKYYNSTNGIKKLLYFRI